MRIAMIHELDIQTLYDEIVSGDFQRYAACLEAGLQQDDLRPRLMQKIFTALAEEAGRRWEQQQLDGSL